MTVNGNQDQASSCEKHAFSAKIATAVGTSGHSQVHVMPVRWEAVLWEGPHTLLLHTQ